MKQNSSIVFHPTSNSLRNCYRRKVSASMVIVCICLGTAAGYTKEPSWPISPEASQSMAKGFKPAQTDLTEIFLQIADSLEFYGSPIPYLRHMEKEHGRIEIEYLQKFGKKPISHRPAYITDDYLNRVSKNWDFLSPKLDLEPFAKEVGHMMRDTIKGTRGTGTIVVDICNEHQSKVFESMKRSGQSDASFEILKAQLITQLELEKTENWVERYEMARRDAVSFALGIHGTTLQLLKKIDQSLSPDDAEKVKTVITSLFMDVGQMAQSELEAGIAEWAINTPSTASN